MDSAILQTVTAMQKMPLSLIPHDIYHSYTVPADYQELSSFPDNVP